MRFFHAGQTLRLIARAMRHKQLDLGEMPDDLRRDLGFLDGQAHYDAAFADRDARSRRLRLPTLTRFPS